MKFLAVFVAIVAVGMSGPVPVTWTLAQLDMALQDPNTDPALIPYMEQALNAIMLHLFSGGQQNYVTVEVPAAILNPELVPVATPVSAATNPSTSPLVQIIVNVNKPEAHGINLPTPTPVQVGPAIVDHVQSPAVNPVDVIAVAAPETPVVAAPGIAGAHVVGPMI